MAGSRVAAHRLLRILVEDSLVLVPVALAVLVVPVALVVPVVLVVPVTVLALVLVVPVVPVALVVLVVPVTVLALVLVVPVTVLALVPVVPVTVRMGAPMAPTMAHVMVRDMDRAILLRPRLLVVVATVVEIRPRLLRLLRHPRLLRHHRLPVAILEPIGRWPFVAPPKAASFTFGEGACGPLAALSVDPFLASPVAFMMPATLTGLGARLPDRETGERPSRRGAGRFGCAPSERSRVSDATFQANGQDGDSALVRACVQGDAAAWEAFHSDWRPRVLGMARRDLRRRGVADAESLAEDVAAEVFARLVARDYRALRGFQGRSSLAGWLAVVTSRCAGRLLERHGRRHAPLEAAGGIADSDESPAAHAEMAERRAAIRKLLNELSPRDRLALQMFYDSGKSYKELAGALGLPVQRVGTILARARARLARSLDRHGGKRS